MFIPSLSLALEYQGQQHYFSTTMYGSAAKRQQVDHLKMEIAQQDGITLIHVPFWWDKSPSSLAATIQRCRPDIKLLDVHPSIVAISSLMPEKYKKPFKYNPNVSQVCNDQLDPTGW